MALMKKIALVNEYVQVPNKTAKAVELKDNDKPVSLEALGLLVNLWSYDVEKWELHKTELYKRFAFNKERSVKAAWNELMAAGYIVEFKYRLGRKWDYVYYYRIKPFSPEEIEQILAQSREEYGKISGLQNEVPKMKSSNCRPQNVELSNKELKQEKSKQKKLIKDSNNTLSQARIDCIREILISYNFSAGERERIVELLLHKDLYLSVSKVELISQAKFMRGRTDIRDRAYYFVNGIEKNIGREFPKTRKKEPEPSTNPIPFYNWLEE